MDYWWRKTAAVCKRQNKKIKVQPNRIETSKKKRDWKKLRGSTQDLVGIKSHFLIKIECQSLLYSLSYLESLASTGWTV